MKKTKLKIMSLVLAGVLSVGFVSYNGYFNNNIKVEASETDEDTSWTVIDYNNLTMADLSADDIALMHENNWLNQEVAKQCSKAVSDLTLSDFLNITKISKYDYNITNIPNSIKFLSNLTYLSIYDNKLTSLPNSIGNLINLNKLFLTKNKLTEIPEAVGNLTNLSCLDLYDNRLTSLPKTIGKLSNLTELHLRYNKLITLPESIGNLTNLTMLQVSDNNLTELPETVGNLTNLTDLYLDNNNLTELPNTIGNLTNLTYLSLGGNNLISLPETIGDLSNLVKLYLNNNNNLTELPNTIGNLTNLTYLNLNITNLISLPETIGNLTNLTDLSLSNNNLTELPNTIGNLTNLTNLYLNENELIELPKTMSNLTNLTFISLNENLLEYIPEYFLNSNIQIYDDADYNLIKDSKKVSQLYYTENVPTELTCSSLNELNTIINNIDYFKNNIEIYTANVYYIYRSIRELNKNIPLKVVPTDDSFFDINGNAIKTGDTYVYVKLNHISDSNPYGYIRKTYNATNPTTVSSNDYVKIPVHIVQRNVSVSLNIGETLPIKDILEKSLNVSDVTEEVNNTKIQSLNQNTLSDEGQALSIGTTQAVLVTPNNGLITVDVNVTNNLKETKTLNVKFTQPNTISLTIDTDEIDFGEVNGLTDSSEKTVIASVNSSLPYDLSIKSLSENLTSTDGKTIPISKLNVKGEGEYTNIGTTDNIIYTNQPNTNGEEVTHPMNFKLSEMTGYTKGEYSTNLRVTATQK